MRLRFWKREEGPIDADEWRAMWMQLHEAFGDGGHHPDCHHYEWGPCNCGADDRRVDAAAPVALTREETE